MKEDYQSPNKYKITSNKLENPKIPDDQLPTLIAIYTLKTVAWRAKETNGNVMTNATNLATL